MISNHPKKLYFFIVVTVAMNLEFKKIRKVYFFFFT